MSLVGRLSAEPFPYGTVVVNITGSFLMGAWIAYMATMLPSRAKDLHLLFAVGVLGGYTTFSTFSLDTFFLIERGLIFQAIVYIVSSVALSLGALIAMGTMAAINWRWKRDLQDEWTESLRVKLRRPVEPGAEPVPPPKARSARTRSRR